MNRVETSTRLLDYVKSLENRDNRTRGGKVISELRALGLEPEIQQCRLPRIRNIVQDLSPGCARLLFSAHYDAVRGSPGANDNASGVAVLLGLCRELRHAALPVRVVFFDREETWLRTPVLRPGVLGSLHYVCNNDCRNLVAAYNLELCGSGDFLGIWPVKENQMGVRAIQEVIGAATRLGIPFGATHFPWLLFSSDHLSFRLRGISRSLTLSLFPADQVPAIQKLLSGVSLKGLLLGHRPAMPEILSRIHTRDDASSHISESSLQLMLSLLLEIVRGAEN